MCLLRCVMDVGFVRACAASGFSRAAEVAIPERPGKVSGRSRRERFAEYGRLETSTVARAHRRYRIGTRHATYALRWKRFSHQRLDDTHLGGAPGSVAV